MTGKPVGFKTVVGAYGWLIALCAEINRRGEEIAPDFITVDSGDGGTGAAPMPLMDNVGLLVRESLPMVADILQAHGLRDRIRLIWSLSIGIRGQGKVQLWVRPLKTSIRPPSLAKSELGPTSI